MVSRMTSANEDSAYPCFSLCLLLVKQRGSRKYGRSSTIKMFAVFPSSIVSVGRLCRYRNFFEVRKDLDFALGKQHPKRCSQPFIYLRITG